MARKHILKQDTFTTWNIDKSNDTLVLDKGARITVSDMRRNKIRRNSGQMRG